MCLLHLAMTLVAPYHPPTFWTVSLLLFKLIHTVIRIILNVHTALERGADI